MESVLSATLGGAIKTLERIEYILGGAGKNLVRAALSRELAKTLGIGRARPDMLLFLGVGKE